MRSLIRVKSFFGLFESSQSVCNDGVGSSDCCETNTASSNTFVVNKLQAEVSQEEISDENLVKIVNLEATDQQCNDLLWKCLGYTYNSDAKNYDNINVFPKWREQYPDPPDVIGITRQYHVEVDKSVRDASVRLVRSIPLSFKGGVRSLESKGFKGYKLAELTPNKTRRAQVRNITAEHS